MVEPSILFGLLFFQRGVHELVLRDRGLVIDCTVMIRDSTYRSVQKL